MRMRTFWWVLGPIEVELPPHKRLQKGFWPGQEREVNFSDLIGGGVIRCLRWFVRWLGGVGGVG